MNYKRLLVAILLSPIIIPLAIVCIPLAALLLIAWGLYYVFTGVFRYRA